MKKLIRKKLALLLASQNKKRPYYCEVEYLESTGTQYIDTGYKMMAGKTMTFNGNIMWTQSNGSANFFYGYRSVNSAEYRGDMRAFFVYGASAPPAGRLAIRYGVNTDNSTSTISQNQKYNISFDGTNLKVNGTTFINLSEAYTPANYQNMWLFNCNTTGYYSADVAKFSGRIYNWQIFEDGVLVRDFIPVLDWNMTPCMYDKVSGQLFYNQGTRDFIAGREIHPVEYLESTGTQYIDTGIKIDDTCGYDISWIALNADDRIIIGTKGSDDSRWVLSGNNNPFLNISWNSVFTTDGLGLNKIQTAKMNYLNDRKRILNDTPLEDISTTLSSSASTYNVGIFAGCWGSGTFSLFSTCRIYYAKITKGSKLVRDFIPAIDSSGTPFMFDRVSHTIYDNAGTGTFAYPPVPIEWVQTDGINSYINTNEIPPSAGILKYLQTKVATLNVFQNSPIFGNAQSEGQVCWGLEYYNSSYSYAYAATKKSYPIHFTSITASSSPVERSIIVTSTQSVYIDGLTYDISAEEYQGTQNNTTICLGRLGPNIIPSAEAHNRFYSAKILNEFVPVFKDGKAGMLNTGTNEFCGNAGTGTIVGGPIIESG